jgi:hypothetical protein
LHSYLKMILMNVKLQEYVSEAKHAH